AGERSHVCIGPRPRAFDLRLSHGSGRRPYVLCVSRAVCAHAGVQQPPSHQEMGGARGASRGGVLSPVVRGGGCDPALLHHDRHRPHRCDDRSPDTYLPHAHGAAFGVLLLAPEAIVHPSFQMSFAATLALVAGYQQGLPWMSKGGDTPLAAKVALWG